MGTTVTGIGTDFENEFEVGDYLWSDLLGEGREITDITNTDTLTSIFLSHLI